MPRFFCLLLATTAMVGCSSSSPDKTALSPEQIQDLLAKGGTNWTSSANSTTFAGTEETEGSRFWIWPSKDEVIVLKRGRPQFSLAWRLRPGQPPLTAKDVESTWTEFRGKTPGTAFGFRGEIKGWHEGESGGNVEIIPGPAVKDYKGDGELLVHFGFKGEVFSNFLSLKVHIEE